MPQSFQDLQFALTQAIDQQGPVLAQVARQIHARPELKYDEHYASQLLADHLRQSGAGVEQPFGGLETAFCARIGKPNSTVKVAILAEYDALPEIGHACGHNLIAAGALGAGLALQSVAADLDGEILLIGTPAEEGGGGKIRLIEAGAFADVDAAIMYHPFDRSLLMLNALAKHTLYLEFTGTPSHAAMAPWDGNSALSGVIQTFNLIDSQRVHFKDGVRVHGIITNGGQADNIIPERAAAQFSLRAPDATYLDEVLVPRIQACAQAAALATGTQVKLTLEMGYKNMRNNQTLARRFGRHLGRLGHEFKETDLEVGTGSTDMGDVSQVVPSIHPYLAICQVGQGTCHQHAFVEAAASDAGIQTMLIAAKSMALTALDLLRDQELRNAVKAEFKA